MFRPECSGLLQGKDADKVFSPFLAGSEEPSTVHATASCEAPLHTYHKSIRGVDH